jgi:hypothetical protein
MRTGLSFALSGIFGRVLLTTEHRGCVLGCAPYGKWGEVEMGWAWKSRDMYVSPQNERYVRGLIRQAQRSARARGKARGEGRSVEGGGGRGVGAYCFGLCCVYVYFLTSITLVGK